MAKRLKQNQEEELINRAIEVFWTKGYNAASARDLMAAMNLGQGSFYLNFKGGKKELYKKSLLQFWKKAKSDFKSGLNLSENPVLFIRSFFTSAASRSNQQMMNGCYLGNALVESSNLDDEIRILSKKLLNEFEKEIEKALKLAQKNNQLSTENSPSQIAKYLINLWNGINVTLRMNPKNKDYTNMIEMHLEILE